MRSGGREGKGEREHLGGRSGGQEERTTSVASVSSLLVDILIRD